MPSREAQIDEALGAKPEVYPTGAFFVEMGNDNFTPNAEDSEFIEFAKKSIRPINDLKLDHHIFFLVSGKNQIVKVEPIWGYKDDDPIRIIGDSYSLRKVNGSIVFSTDQYVE